MTSFFKPRTAPGQGQHGMGHKVKHQVKPQASLTFTPGGPPILDPRPDPSSSAGPSSHLYSMPWPARELGQMFSHITSYFTVQPSVHWVNPELVRDPIMPPQRPPAMPCPVKDASRGGLWHPAPSGGIQQQMMMMEPMHLFNNDYNKLPLPKCSNQQSTSFPYAKPSTSKPLNPNAKEWVPREYRMPTNTTLNPTMAYRDKAPRRDPPAFVPAMSDEFCEITEKEVREARDYPCGTPLGQVTPHGTVGQGQCRVSVLQRPGNCDKGVKGTEELPRLSSGLKRVEPILKPETAEMKVLAGSGEVQNCSSVLENSLPPEFVPRTKIEGLADRGSSRSQASMKESSSSPKSTSASTMDGLPDSSLSESHTSVLESSMSPSAVYDDGRECVCVNQSRTLPDVVGVREEASMSGRTQISDVEKSCAVEKRERPKLSSEGTRNPTVVSLSSSEGVGPMQIQERSDLSPTNRPSQKTDQSTSESPVVVRPMLLTGRPNWPSVSPSSSRSLGPLQVQRKSVLNPTNRPRETDQRKIKSPAVMICQCDISPASLSQAVHRSLESTQANHLRNRRTVGQTVGCVCVQGVNDPQKPEKPQNQRNTNISLDSSRPSPLRHEGRAEGQTVGHVTAKECPKDPQIPENATNQRNPTENNCSLSYAGVLGRSSPSPPPPTEPSDQKYKGIEQPLPKIFQHNRTPPRKEDTHGRQESSNPQLFKRPSKTQRTRSRKFLQELKESGQCGDSRGVVIPYSFSALISPSSSSSSSSVSPNILPSPASSPVNLPHRSSPCGSPKGASSPQAIPRTGNSRVMPGSPGGHTRSSSESSSASLDIEFLGHDEEVPERVMSPGRCKGNKGTPSVRNGFLACILGSGDTDSETEDDDDDSDWDEVCAEDTMDSATSMGLINPWETFDMGLVVLMERQAAPHTQPSNTDDTTTTADDHTDTHLDDINKRWNREVEKDVKGRTDARVTFGGTEVRNMVVWDHAYRQARKGPWEQQARDRARFLQRVATLEPVLCKVLEADHRRSIYSKVCEAES